MAINAYVIGELVKLDKAGKCPSTPPELRSTLLQSKRAKGFATVFINICMLAHVPTTYLYEMSCETSALGPHEARGTTFYSLSACIEVLRRSTEYCEPGAMRTMQP